MAKILNGAGFAISGRIGKSVYIGRSTVGGNILAVESKPFEIGERHRQFGKRVRAYHLAYKKYATAVRKGLPFISAKKYGDKSYNSVVQFIKLNCSHITSGTQADSFTLSTEKLIIANGNLDLPAGINIQRNTNTVKATWTPPPADASPAEKARKVALLVLAKADPAKVFTSVGATTLESGTAELPITLGTEPIVVYFFVYDDNPKSRASSQQHSVTIS